MNMATLEMGILFYPEGIKKLQIDTKIYSSRTAHSSLLKQEAIAAGIVDLEQLIAYNDIEKLYYLIECFTNEKIPFLQEVNDMNPKRYILFLPNNIMDINENQIEMLISKFNAWKRFRNNGNKLAILLYPGMCEFLEGNYELIDFNYFISQIYRLKYSSVMKMDSSVGDNKKRL